MAAAPSEAAAQKRPWAVPLRAPWAYCGLQRPASQLGNTLVHT